MYAMKVLKKSHTNDGKIKQIMQERQIMEQLDHPYIVKLYWAFQSVNK
jgi:serine/threonine protein kinase